MTCSRDELVGCQATFGKAHAYVRHIRRDILVISQAIRNGRTVAYQVASLSTAGLGNRGTHCASIGPLLFSRFGSCSPSASEGREIDFSLRPSHDRLIRLSSISDCPVILHTETTLVHHVPSTELDLSPLPPSPPDASPSVRSRSCARGARSGCPLRLPHPDDSAETRLYTAQNPAGVGLWRPRKCRRRIGPTNAD